MSKPAPGRRVVGVEMPDDLIRRLDERAERLRIAGHRGSRGDVVRMLLIRALDEEEKRVASVG
jgi:metal-responsive CopG/Arc/MetJ family transcriptional regulator